MKKFIKTGVALTTAAILLSGCGEGLLVMNEAEEAIVVSYSAGALAKRNRYQPEGLTAVYEGEEDEAEEPADTPAEPEDSQNEPTDSMDEEPVDIIEPEDGLDTDASDAEGGGSAAGKGTDDAPEAAEISDLAEALGLSGIQMSYTDYAVNSSYQQGDYFSLDADPGNTFVILNFNVTNNTAEEIQCDMLTKQPIFTLEIDGGASVRNEVTVLANDISTYHEAIGAGQTEAAILLFEVSEDVAGNISSLQLSVQTDGAANRLAIE